MFLSAREIRREVDAGRVGIDPFLPSLLKPASYVLRLGTRVSTWLPAARPIRVWSKRAGWEKLVSKTLTTRYTLPSGGFILASTLETICIPHGLVGLIATLSHMARFGVSVHMNSFWVSPGFGVVKPSRITLEIVSHNPSPLELEPGLPICHLALARAGRKGSEAFALQNSVYEGELAPGPPRLYDEFHDLIDLRKRGLKRHE